MYVLVNSGNLKSNGEIMEKDKLSDMAIDAGFRIKDVHHAFLEDNNEFIEFHNMATNKYKKAIMEALSVLKNGNRTWECMDILEKALK